VQHDQCEQDDAHGPEDFVAFVQELAVGVEPVGADEELKIPHHVRENEEHQREAADAHDVLLPEGRMPDFHEKIHAACTSKTMGEVYLAGAITSTDMKRISNEDFKRC
jgi:hypothetical protein